MRLFLQDWKAVNCANGIQTSEHTFNTSTQSSNTAFDRNSIHHCKISREIAVIEMMSMIGRYRRFYSLLILPIICRLHVLAQDVIFRPEMPSNIGLRLEYYITPEQYESCRNDFKKTIEKKKVFSQDSFLQFVKLRTEGVIDKDLFDTSILELVYIYWFTICTVETELCSETEFVSSDEVIGFYYENGEPLTEEICERIQYYIDRYITSKSPTNAPSLSTEPSLTPSHSYDPSSIPSIRPSSSPTLLSLTESLSFQIQYANSCANDIIIEKLSIGLRKQFGCDSQLIQECQFDIEVLISEFLTFGTYCNSYIDFH